MEFDQSKYSRGTKDTLIISSRNFTSTGQDSTRKLCKVDFQKNRIGLQHLEFVALQKEGFDIVGRQGTALPREERAGDWSEKSWDSFRGEYVQTLWVLSGKLSLVAFKNKRSQKKELYAKRSFPRSPHPIQARPDETLRQDKVETDTAMQWPGHAVQQTISSQPSSSSGYCQSQPQQMSTQLMSSSLTQSSKRVGYQDKWEGKQEPHTQGGEEDVAISELGFQLEGRGTPSLYSIPLYTHPRSSSPYHPQEYRSIQPGPAEPQTPSLQWPGHAPQQTMSYQPSSSSRYCQSQSQLVSNKPMSSSLTQPSMPVGYQDNWEVGQEPHIQAREGDVAVGEPESESESSETPPLDTIPWYTGA